jgi:hypothetical protein
MARVRKKSLLEDEEQGQISSHCISLVTHITIIIEFFVLISFLSSDSCFLFTEKIRRKGKRKLASTVDDDGNTMNLDSTSFIHYSYCEVAQ